ncbi:MAG: 2-amino-4-hydroxy-6-hydroxymethyldihydropteridine diphosphokinase [Pseudomonadota bacterium]
MNRAYIAFGANLSNPRETLMRSLEALAGAGVIVDRVSNLWRSPAWPPGSDAPDYTNAVMAVRTTRTAHMLMTLLLDIETALGRTRSVRNAPRSCDLDLLDYAGLVSADPGCTLPHPRMSERDFVLLPLAEVAEAGWRHPVSGMGVEAMLGRLK